MSDNDLTLAQTLFQQPPIYVPEPLRYKPVALTIEFDLRDEGERNDVRELARIVQASTEQVGIRDIALTPSVLLRNVAAITEFSLINGPGIGTASIKALVWNVRSVMPASEPGVTTVARLTNP
jgi:hypothetical protein